MYPINWRTSVGGALHRCRVLSCWFFFHPSLLLLLYRVGLFKHRMRDKEERKNEKKNDEKRMKNTRKYLTRFNRKSPSNQWDKKWARANIIVVSHVSSSFFLSFFHLNCGFVFNLKERANQVELCEITIKWKPQHLKWPRTHRIQNRTGQTRAEQSKKYTWLKWMMRLCVCMCARIPWNRHQLILFYFNFLH